MTTELKSLKFNNKFLEFLGGFYGAWSSWDLVMDFAICRFMKITPEQTHLLTAGMQFGPKARLLADLIGRSTHPQKSKLLGALNKIRGEAKREVLAHAYLTSDANTVTFIDRKSGGEYRAQKTVFTLPEFVSHVGLLINTAFEFQEALGVGANDLPDFVQAAFNANRRADASPQKPAS